MGENDLDFTKLDEELEVILYDDRYKSIREFWKEPSKYNLEFIWHWFLWEYDKIFPNGIFDPDGRMKPAAERAYNEWFNKNKEKIVKILQK